MKFLIDCSNETSKSVINCLTKQELLVLKRNIDFRVASADMFFTFNIRVITTFVVCWFLSWLILPLPIFFIMWFTARKRYDNIIDGKMFIDERLKELDNETNK